LHHSLTSVSAMSDMEDIDEGEDKIRPEEQHVEGFSSDEEEEPEGPQCPWGLKKKLIEEGDEERVYPKSQDEVSVHYVVQLKDGTQVYSTRQNNDGKPKTFVLENNPRDVVCGLDWAVQTMRKNEIAEFTVHPKLAYDDYGAPGVPKNATLCFKVELLGWVTKDDLFGDQRAVKTIVTEGLGEERAVEGQEVVLSWKLTSRGGKTLEERGDEEFTVGSPVFGPVSRVVSRAVTRMAEGERATVLLSRDCVPSDERRYAGATLELYLSRIFECRDVVLSGDKVLRIKVLQKGTGHHVARDAAHAKMLVESVTDGDALLPGFSGPKILEFTIGDGEVCDALEIAVLTMKAGERSLVTSRRPDLCSEPTLGLANLDARQVVWTVELQEVDEGTDTTKLSPENLAVFAAARKEVGTQLFKRGRHALALERFTKVTSLVDTLEKNGQLEPQTVELRRTCGLNAAACMLKTGDPHGAKAACDVVLSREPSHAKALYRRASAFLALSHYTAAAQDLNAILRQNSQNAEARALLAQVRVAQKQYAADAKAAASRMIASTALPPVTASVSSAGAEATTDPKTATLTQEIARETQDGTTSPTGPTLLKRASSKFLTCAALPCGKV